MLPYAECPTAFSCVLWDAWEFIDWRAITLTACFWIAAMLVAYVRGRRRQVKRLWLGAFKGSVVTFAAIGLFLLGIIFFYSPSQRYKVLREYTIKTLGEKDQTIADQKKKIQDLEAKVKEEPKIVWRDKPSSSVPQGGADAEVARLRAELDQREKRKSIRSDISKLLDEAIKFRQAFLIKEEKKDLVPSVNAWADRAYKYLQSVEPSYASRFVASPTSSLVYTDVPTINNNALTFLDAKMRTLSTILGELRD